MPKRTPWLLLFVCLVARPKPGEAQSWEVAVSGTDSNLRGVSVVPDREGGTTVWASGSHGVVMRSADGGRSWKRVAVPGAESLDFRGVRGFGRRTAYLVSSGEGEKSRIYKTTDGGSSWKLVYSDERKEFFLDAIACLSETECFALGDPMDGRFVLLHSKDGERWERLAASGLRALPGEGAFAASNSCLAVDTRSGIYFVTGGPVARLFHSRDSGKTWTVADLPVAKGNPSSGGFSVAIAGRTLLVAGGDYREPEKSAGTMAYSTDGGTTWKQPRVPPQGFRSAVAAVEGAGFLAVGPGGSESSRDHGNDWKQAGSAGWNALEAHGREIWAVGANGTVAKFRWAR